MIAHPWRLGADVTALENGALQWGRVAGDLTATADDLVAAARHALDAGWESEAAESFELQRRTIVQQIDAFTTVAARISSSLTALAAMLRTAQEELDRSWAAVSSVPHELVGTEGVLVLRPANPADEELVRSATETARAIRGRLQDQLDEEATRLRESRMELVTVRHDLGNASGGSWAVPGVGGVAGTAGTTGDAGVLPSGSLAQLGGPEPGELAGSATSVAGAAAGAAGGAVAAATPLLPPVEPISVDMPALTGLSAAALAAGAGAAGLSAAAAKGGRRREDSPVAGTGVAPMGGMAAGAAMRGGTLGRPGAGGQAPRGQRPSLAGQESAEEKAARLAREKEAAREAKRKLIAERRAERAARRAQRAGGDGDRPRPVIEVSEVAPGEDRRPPRG